MKILIASLFFPYPEVTHAGGTNLFHYIEALNSRGHQVSLASYINEWEHPYIDVMRAYCAEIETIPAISTFGQRLDKFPYLFRYPLQWVEAYSPRMRNVLKGMLAKQKYDVIHFEHLWMGQYQSLVQGCAIVLDEVDVDSLVLFRRYRQARPFWRKIYLWWNWLRTIQLEADVCTKMDLIFTRSDKDCKYLQCLIPGRDFRILPPWFEGLDLHSLPLEQVEPHSLLFVGNMSRSPNVEAVVYFCEKIMQRILDEVPDAKLYVVGDAPQENVRQLAGDHVIVTGFVENLVEYYGRCQVFVAPLLTGGGIIVKILDALSAGRPVVCTSIGNEGIEAKPGRDICVADRPVEFANSVIRLLNDPQHWQEIATNGNGFFKSKYCWEIIVDNMEMAYLDKIHKISTESGY